MHPSLMEFMNISCFSLSLSHTHLFLSFFFLSLSLTHLTLLLLLFLSISHTSLLSHTSLSFFLFLSLTHLFLSSLFSPPPPPPTSVIHFPPCPLYYTQNSCQNHLIQNGSTFKAKYILMQPTCSLYNDIYTIYFKTFFRLGKDNFFLHENQPVFFTHTKNISSQLLYNQPVYYLFLDQFCTLNAFYIYLVTSPKPFFVDFPVISHIKISSQLPYNQPVYYPFFDQCCTLNAFYIYLVTSPKPFFDDFPVTSHIKISSLWLYSQCLHHGL